MAKVVTLYIDDTSLRLLVARGKRVEKWARLPLEPGLVRDGVVVDEAKVATKIKELLNAQRVRTKNVIAGLSGLRCLTRPITLPQLPRAVLVEAIRQEAERIMPVPLEQLYLAWQIIPTPGAGMQVYLVALPRNAADAMVRTLRQAGVEPYLMDIKPLALAKAVREATAVIVDVQPTEFDIIIMVDGIPQPIRTLSLPVDAKSWQEKLPIIAQELDRSVKFYNASHSENPLAPSISIFVSGELAQESEACQSLADELKYSVLPLLPPLKYPQSLPASQYMVNCGLALKKLSPGKGASFSVVNLNALPDVYRPKAPSLTNILIAPGFLVAIGLLVLLVMRVQSAAADTASLRTQLDITNQLLKERQVQMKDIAELEKKIGEVEASCYTFTVAFNNFGKQRAEINGDLSVATGALPATINLSSIAHVSGDLTISGVAPDEDEVLKYARDLRASGRFSQVIISTMEKTEDGVSFKFILTK